jgi:hypothetical protein
VRRKGHSQEDAKDLTQIFSTRHFQKGGTDRIRGWFRSFLLTACQYYFATTVARFVCLFVCLTPRSRVTRYCVGDGQHSHLAPSSCAEGERGHLVDLRPAAQQPDCLVLLVLLLFAGNNTAFKLIENGEVALLEDIGDSLLLHHCDVHARWNGAGQRDRLARSVIMQEEKDSSPWSYPVSYLCAKKIRLVFVIVEGGDRIFFIEKKNGIFVTVAEKQ